MGDGTGKPDEEPEDWQEQGWCCRPCAVLAWNGMSPELRRELTRDPEQIRRNAEYERYAYGKPGIRL